jgi:5-deoxy-glucuronate isomerase
MKVPNTKPYKLGYNSIIEMDGKFSEMMMDFGILMMNKGLVYENEEEKERAFLLIGGKAEFEWEGQKELAIRGRWKDENPWCLSVPRGVKVKITGRSDTVQIAIHQTNNEKKFPSKLYHPEDIPSLVRGKGVNDDTARRVFRTIIDRSINPDSNFVLGEDVHAAGRWSGYPNHYHPQPEIYHFKFYPDNGFGLQRLGNDAIFLEEDDTVTIYPNEVHPCVGAPGYNLYYIWAIRDFPDKPYEPIFEMQHTWLPGIWVPDEEKYFLP